MEHGTPAFATIGILVLTIGIGWILLLARNR
jgi:ubiquinone biosynthesis protein